MIILTHEIIEKVKDHYGFTVLIKSIAYRASYTEKSCFPTLKTISEDCGFSVSTVKRALNYLVSIEIIKVINRKNPNTNEKTSNLYVINTDLISITGKLKIEGKIEGGVGSHRTDLGSHRAVGGFSQNHKPQDQLTTSSLNQGNKTSKNFQETKSNLDPDLIIQKVKEIFPFVLGLHNFRKIIGAFQVCENPKELDAYLDYLKTRVDKNPKEKDKIAQDTAIKSFLYTDFKNHSVLYPHEETLEETEVMDFDELLKN